MLQASLSPLSTTTSRYEDRTDMPLYDIDIVGVGYI